MHKPINANSKNIVAGLGNFDGVHLGHQRLIGVTTTLAGELNAMPAIITFDPHPQRVLNPDNAPLLLTERSEKERKIKDLGINTIIWLPFSPKLASLSSEDFVRQIIVGKYHCKGVVVGYNYTFGAGGEGKAETMVKLGSKYDFQVRVVPAVTTGGMVVSSTAVRDYMRQGDIERAAGMLGSYPSMKGKVMCGDGRGKEIGFPTANLDVPQGVLIPGNGVYAVNVLVDEDMFLGVANIGTRPTFYGSDNARNIEVHLLDFRDNLYGKVIKIVFKKRIRNEKTFSSVEGLVRQIQVDIRTARSVG